MPIWTRRPRLITAIRVAVLSASSWSWVTTRKVVPTPLLDADQLEPGLGAQLAVECRQRFVEQQQLGHLGERARQGHALPLTARQLVRATPAIIRHLDQRQHLADAGGDAPAVHSFLAQAKGDVARHVHVREERIGLEHHIDRPRIGRQCSYVGAVDDDTAAVGGLEPGDHPQQGRLAAARGPQQREERAALDGQRDVVDRCDRAEPLRGSGDFEQRHPSDHRPDLSRVQARVRARS